MFLYTRVLVIKLKKKNWSYAWDVVWSYAKNVCQECMKTEIALKFFGCREKRIKYLSFSDVENAYLLRFSITRLSYLTWPKSTVFSMNLSSITGLTGYTPKQRNRE